MIPVAESTTISPGKKRKSEKRSRTAQESLRIPKPQLIMLLQVVNFSMVSIKQLYMNQWLIMKP